MGLLPNRNCQLERCAHAIPLRKGVTPPGRIAISGLAAGPAQPKGLVWHGERRCCLALHGGCVGKWIAIALVSSRERLESLRAGFRP